MEYISVKVYRNDNGKKIELPAYMSDHAAGMDVCASQDATIEPGTAVLVKTGLFVEIPEGYELQVRPRSGLALKHSILVPNSPGTIDADYRGEVGVILFNAGKESFSVHAGDRIAQLVLNQVDRVRWHECGSFDDLNATKRGEGGFGHTGR